MSVTADLLPPSALPQERALSLAIRRAAEVDTPLRKLWRAGECPTDILPWLAWSLGVDHWDSSWSPEQKRASIVAAFSVHAKRGTIGGIGEAVRALGYGTAVIVENIDGPFTFTVRLEGVSAALTEAHIREVERVVLAAKNARSHFRSIVSTTTAGAGTGIHAAAVLGDTITVTP